MRFYLDTHKTQGVSVVVITRDRPEHLQVCLNALLASTLTNFELVVVDQSTRSDSGSSIRRLAGQDGRVRLVTDSGKGAARARNIGTAATTGDIVVFTDDDCEPERDWLASIVTALCDYPEAGIAFGSVIPGPHDPDDGFIVGFAPTHRQRLRGRLSKLRDKGISANVALRRSALQASGGFDEMLGPGSYFPCAEDYDLTYRVLSRGYTLVHEPKARVLHHGLRDWRSGSSLVKDTYVAIGAAYMKHVRLGDAIGAALLAHELWLALLNILLHVLRARGPFGFGRLCGLLLGMWRSFELEVEPGHALYTAPGLRLTARSSADSSGRVPVGPSDSAAKTARL